jgi:hypothetical protein
MIQMESTKNAILSGDKASLDKKRIGSQSHFNKEEILFQMLHFFSEEQVNWNDYKQNILL